MNSPIPLAADLRPAPGARATSLDREAVVRHHSGVSWGAVLAGAAGAAALSLILLVLGTGLGMTSVSPWTDRGVSAATFGMTAIAWITLTQIAASGMGGYLAGRLRTRWSALHTDEVYFRDTAHGFLAWAIATLATAAMLASAIGSITGAGAQAGAAVAGGAATTAAMAAGPAVAGAAQRMAPGSTTSGGEASRGTGYLVDTLFRKDSSAANNTGTGTPDDSARSSAEVGRILSNAFGTGTLTPEDTKYAGQLVAQRTGLSQADAEKRVTDTYAAAQAKLKDAETAARDAADKARKAAAYASLWLFVSLLAGAFAASLAATYGGRRRDLF